jgi:NAD(P)-dependent dehydrogenase (short-subunit alcohol dehydrogenase family)
MKTIVMTGATSGIGAVAATHLVKDNRVVTGARGGAVSGAELRPLDLASLASVRAFADGLKDEAIDVLVLNAGIQMTDVDHRSADGHELAFAVNHLAHYLLLRLLTPQLTAGARVVITASGTHDPDDVRSLPGPRHADAAMLADPATDPMRDEKPRTAGQRAYATSKLLNVLTARQFAKLNPGMVTVAYDPGLTTGTRLVRASPGFVQTVIWPMLGLLRFVNDGVNKLEDSGAALAALATDEPVPAGEIYAALRKGMIRWKPPSVAARDDAVAAKLWADSAAMVGL